MKQESKFALGSQSKTPKFYRKVSQLQRKISTRFLSKEDIMKIWIICGYKTMERVLKGNDEGLLDGIKKVVIRNVNRKLLITENSFIH